jgi:hypothetical protein
MLGGSYLAALKSTVLPERRSINCVMAFTAISRTVRQSRCRRFASVAASASRLRLQLLAGCTSLVIADRLSTIRGADRVVVLERRRVVEQGSPEELRAAGGHFAQLAAESERLT